MGFFDLNIPYHESDRNLSNKDKATLKTHRLKLAIKVAELGYTGIAYNREIKGVMSEADRCSISLFPLSSLLKVAPSLSSSVKFHRELLKVPVSTPYRQYTRLTVIVDSPAQAASLNSGNPILKSYDIVAVRPMNQNSFDHTCQTSEVDVIAIDFSEKLPFRLKQPMVQAAIKRGVYFEITYSSLMRDAQVRRQMISNAKLLVGWTRGNNLIVASAASPVSEIRGPYDVANLLSLLGLSCERAKTAISKNCRSAIANALRKKQYYKEAIKVEAMPLSRRFDSKEQEFNDWLKWDPISSGEGDLMLDDIEKSFSASGTITNAVNPVRLESALISLPSHGLQIKDFIPTANSAAEPLDIDKSLGNPGEIDVANTVNGISEVPTSEEGQTSVKSSHQELSNEDSMISLLHDTSLDGSIHVKENSDLIVAFEELTTAKELNSCSSPPEREIRALRAQNYSDNYSQDLPLLDDATVHGCANDTEIIRSCDGFGPAGISIHLEDTVTSNEKECKMSISFSKNLHSEALLVEEDKKTEGKKDKDLSLELPDVPLNQEFKENGPCQTTIDRLELLTDEMLGEESHNQNEEGNVFSGDENELTQEEALEKQTEAPVELSYQIRGRGRRKRRMSYQPVLSPFRNLLIYRPSKKKVQRLNPL